jgi:hypothetical protein
MAKSNCVHYALNGKNILIIKNLFKTLQKNLDLRKFKITRIVKPQSSYIRLSIGFIVPSETRSTVIETLEIFHDLKLKKLKIRPNLDLKSKGRVEKYQHPYIKHKQPQKQGLRIGGTSKQT